MFFKEECLLNDLLSVSDTAELHIKCAHYQAVLWLSAVGQTMICNRQLGMDGMHPKGSLNNLFNAMFLEAAEQVHMSCLQTSLYRGLWME